MANVKTILDTRRAKSGGNYNIIYRITYKRRVYTINSGISIQEKYWDFEHSKIKNDYPNSKLLNLELLNGYVEIEKAILTLKSDFTIQKLRSIVKGEPSNEAKSFKMFAQELIDKMLATNKTGNAIVYRTAVNRFVDFCGRDMLFTDIDYNLLDAFKHHLIVSGLKQNSISNYFRTIRAIYNKAIKHKIVDRTSYPFYDFSIKSQRTTNRAISKTDLKSLIELLPGEEDSPSWNALNYFMLSFYLRGISFTDMAYLKRSSIVNGRILYKRRKTHKLYSIKLFTPAERIIEYFQSNDNVYLLPVLNQETIEDSKEAKRLISQWIKTTNKYLKRLGERLELNIPLTTYVSRYSFATIAKHLGYSNELIAEALGHEYGNKTTNIYLDVFDENKLDTMHFNVIKS